MNVLPKADNQPKYFDIMSDKILCPKCKKLNDIHKFCIYCGEKLLNDDQFKLITENTDPTCLNCGRPVEKDQNECECGYKFMDINCPDCNSKNKYSNKFCIECGNRLWRSNVSPFKYSERLFENHIIKEKLPYHLRNTSLYERPKNNIGKNPVQSRTLADLKKEHLKVDKNLTEIKSRWKIVSPNYCIRCLDITDSSKNTCQKCGNILSDKTRMDFIKRKYIKPLFDNKKLKWTSKNDKIYLRSLSPAPGESQFEYRERLKWEYSENIYYEKSIKSSENRIMEFERIERENKRKAKKLKEESERKAKERAKQIEDAGGWYCNSSCQHCYEEFFDGNGAIVGSFESGGYSEEYCRLGHRINKGSFCEDYNGC